LRCAVLRLNNTSRYTDEYALLISEAQAIKQELVAVEAKVTRSTSLLKSLSQEQERWEQTSDSFKSQVRCPANIFEEVYVNKRNDHPAIPLPLCLAFFDGNLAVTSILVSLSNLIKTAFPGSFSAAFFCWVSCFGTVIFSKA